MLKYIFKLCKMGDSVKVNPVFLNTVKQNKMFKTLNSSLSLRRLLQCNLFALVQLISSLTVYSKQIYLFSIDFHGKLCCLMVLLELMLYPDLPLTPPYCQSKICRNFSSANSTHALKPLLYIQAQNTACARHLRGSKRT